MKKELREKFEQIVAALPNEGVVANLRSVSIESIRQSGSVVTLRIWWIIYDAARNRKLCAANQTAVRNGIKDAFPSGDWYHTNEFTIAAQ